MNKKHVNEEIGKAFNRKLEVMSIRIKNFKKSNPILA